MAIRIYSEHGKECEFDEPEFLTAIAYASRLIGKPPRTVLTRMRTEAAGAAAMRYPTVGWGDASGSSMRPA